MLQSNTREGREERRKAAKKRQDARIAARMSSRPKRCAGCGERKPRSEFPKHDGSSDGFASYCKACKNNMHSNRRRSSPKFRIKHHIATRVTKQLKDSHIKSPPRLTQDLEKYLDYPIAKLCRHLEADLQMREGITLKESLERGYHLDHIYPLSRFSISSIDSKAFRDCWAINNLRMIPAEENIAKSNKVTTAVAEDITDE